MSAIMSIMHKGLTYKQLLSLRGNAPIKLISRAMKPLRGSSGAWLKSTSNEPTLDASGLPEIGPPPSWLVE
jgi:hypothetical protein